MIIWKEEGEGEEKEEEEEEKKKMMEYLTIKTYLLNKRWIYICKIL